MDIPVELAETHRLRPPVREIKDDPNSSRAAAPIGGTSCAGVAAAVRMFADQHQSTTARAGGSPLGVDMAHERLPPHHVSVNGPTSIVRIGAYTGQRSSQRRKRGGSK